MAVDEGWPVSGRVLDPRAVNDTEALEWRGVLIHHSATSPTVTAKSITDYHVKERGWIDVGYHGLIEMDLHGGFKFVPGRDLSLPGSHCPGKNRTHLGLCLIGNFMHSTPPILQLEVAAEILAEWCVVFDFSPEEIHPHRAFRQTDCPGLVDILALRRSVTRILVDD